MLTVWGLPSRFYSNLIYIYIFFFMLIIGLIKRKCSCILMDVYKKFIITLQWWNETSCSRIRDAFSILDAPLLWATFTFHLIIWQMLLPKVIYKWGTSQSIYQTDANNIHSIAMPGFTGKLKYNNSVDKNIFTFIGRAF